MTLLIALTLYFKEKDIYTVTAYCNCKICINKKGFRDNRFASGKRTFFGGAAADPKIPFGTYFRIIPLTEADDRIVGKLFKGRKNYVVEDRGFLIKGKSIDIFIPRRLGAHKTAKRWGRRRMKVIFEKPSEKPG